MLAIRNIYKDQSGKNQAKAIILVINKYSLKEKLGYFMINNTFSNDIFVTKIINLI